MKVDPDRRVDFRSPPASPPEAEGTHEPARTEWREVVPIDEGSLQLVYAAPGCITFPTPVWRSVVSRNMERSYYERGTSGIIGPDGPVPPTVAGLPTVLKVADEGQYEESVQKLAEYTARVMSSLYVEDVGDDWEVVHAILTKVRDGGRMDEGERGTFSIPCKPYAAS